MVGEEPSGIISLIPFLPKSSVNSDKGFLEELGGISLGDESMAEGMSDWVDMEFESKTLRIKMRRFYRE